MVNVMNIWDHNKAKYLSRGSINAEKTIWYIHQKEHIIYQYLIFSNIFIVHAEKSQTNTWMALYWSQGERFTERPPIRQLPWKKRGWEEGNFLD